MDGIQIVDNRLTINLHINNVAFVPNPNGSLFIEVAPRDDTADDILNQIRERNSEPTDVSDVAKQYSTPNLMSFKEFLKNNKF